VAMLCGVGPASATLAVGVSGLGNCTDGTSCDKNGASGVVALQNTDGTLAATGSAGPSPSDLALHFTVGSGDPTFQLSETGLSGSSLSWTASIKGIQDRATTSWSFFADTSNTLFGKGTLICSGSSVAPVSFSSTCSSPLLAFSGLFSLTEVITVTGGTSSGDAILKATTLVRAAVPEPGTLLLLGSGVAVAGMWRGRRAFGKRQK